MHYVRDAVAMVSANPYLQAVIILVAAAIVAKAVTWFLDRGLLRLARRTRAEIDDDVIRALDRPVFYSIFLFACRWTVTLGIVPEALQENVSKTLLTLLIAIWLFFGMHVTGMFLDWMQSHPKRFSAIQRDTKPIFDIGLKILLLGGAIYLLLEAWGVNPAGWLTSAGVAGIVIGLAAKDSLANLFAGVFILADAPYKVGDFVVMADERGVVTHIGLRSTRILTRDDIEITLPNSIIANSKIINESGGPWIKHRVRAPVGVAYGSDVDQVREVLTQVALENEKVCRDPEPRVRFRGFGDSSLNFDLLCWIENPQDRGLTLDMLFTATYKSLAQAGIEIPFPKRDVYIKQIPPGLTAKEGR